MRCGGEGVQREEKDMHHVVVDVAVLLHAHRHTRHQVVGEALRLDARHVLHDPLVGTFSSTTVRGLGTTIDGAENCVHLHEIVVLHCLQERCIRLHRKQKQLPLANKNEPSGTCP